MPDATPKTIERHKLAGPKAEHVIVRAADLDALEAKVERLREALTDALAVMRDHQGSGSQWRAAVKAARDALDA